MDKISKTWQQLETEGWKTASVTGGTHLKRTLEIYREPGTEIYLEKAKPEECQGWTQCFTENNEAIYRIYTRSYYK